MIEDYIVAGTEARLIALPAFTKKALAAFIAFTESDDLFGLDVETTAIPMFEGSRRVFGPAMMLAEYTVPSDVSDAYRARGFLPGQRRSVKTRTIQFGSKTRGWVLDVDHPRWREEIRAFLDDDTKRFVSHNASFDAVRVLHEFGVQLGDRSIDSLPMAKLIWPGRTVRAGLKDLCVLVFDDDLLKRSEDALHARFADLFYSETVKLPKSFEPGYSPCRNCKTETSWVDSLRGFCRLCYTAAVGCSQKVIDWGWDNIALDDPVFLKYAGLDAVYVRHLVDALGAELRRRGMSKLSRTEQTVKRMMVASSMTGKRVDLDWTHDVLDEIAVEYDGAVEAVLQTTGLKVRSPKMREWLAERGCVTSSLDKKHLPGLLLKHKDNPEVLPVLEHIATYSANSNLLANLNTILRHAEGGNGFVHPNINTLQAHTGRMSVTGPAMQTFAKNGLKGERLRGCFIARDGFVFVGADYDGQETTIAADLSGDKVLNEVVSTGVSQHVLTAKGIWPHFDKASMPVEYGQAKILDFAQQYGAGPKAIALQMGISVPEARALWLAWRETYFGLVEWTDEQTLKSRVTNPYGRSIPSDPHRPYANGNYIIQSAGRDVLGEALVSLSEAGWGPSVWLPIHDEIVLEVPVGAAERAALELGECMTTVMPGRTLPIKATGEIIGDRWRGL